MRSRLWIAAAESGQHTITAFVERHLAKFRHCFEGATVASIRKRVGHDSLPIVYDVPEPEGLRVRRKLRAPSPIPSTADEGRNASNRLRRLTFRPVA